MRLAHLVEQPRLGTAVGELAPALDLTTIRVEGLSEQSGEVRKFGMSKEGMVARQFLLGVMQTADGLPIYHEVFAGNASDNCSSMSGRSNCATQSSTAAW